MELSDPVLLTGVEPVPFTCYASTRFGVKASGFLASELALEHDAPIHSHTSLSAEL